jgi:hypothetical protein
MLAQRLFFQLQFVGSFLSDEAKNPYRAVSFRNQHSGFPENWLSESNLIGCRVDDSQRKF